MRPSESYYMSQWTQKPQLIERRTPYLLEAISLAVSTLIYAGSFAFVQFRLTHSLSETPQMVAIATLIVIGSEMTRDIVAKILGVSSEFVLWPLGIIMVFLSSFFGNVFSIPGHSIIGGGTKFRRSIVSATTPIFAFFVSMLFIFFSPFGREINQLALQMALAYGCYEILPISPLKGKAVWDSSKLLWLLIFVPLYLLYFWFVLLA